MFQVSLASKPSIVEVVGLKLPCAIFLPIFSAESILLRE